MPPGQLGLGLSGSEFSEGGCGSTSHPVTAPGGEACVAQRGGPACGRVGSGVRLRASGSPAPQRCAAHASPARSFGSKRVPLVQRARLHLPPTPHQLGASTWLEQQPCRVMGLPLHSVLPDTARAMLLTCTPAHPLPAAKPTRHQAAVNGPLGLLCRMGPSALSQVLLSQEALT